MKTGINMSAKADIESAAGVAACIASIMDKAFETRASDKVTLAALDTLRNALSISGATISNVTIGDKLITN